MSGHPYGYCPNCGYPGVSRERRPNGDDHCASGCTYPSRMALRDPPAKPANREPLAYVCGFLFSEDRHQVCLIRKAKPAWQAGKLNGVGGKIERNELPIAAMTREFLEETGLFIDSWQRLAILRGIEGVLVHFFVSFSDDVFGARTMEDKGETVRCYAVGELDAAQLVPNLSFLIPLALDQSGILKPVHLTDERAAA